MSIPQSGGGLIESFDQLASYLEAGCKPRADWRIGTEHEKFGFVEASHAPLPYDGPRSIKALLEGLRDRFGWSQVLEQGKIIGLSRNGASVSLEPGGQFELSGAPLETTLQVQAELENHLSEVRAVTEGWGIGFLGLGAPPPVPEWGRVLAEGMPYIERAGWSVFAPAAALAVLSVMAVTLSSLRWKKSSMAH